MSTGRMRRSSQNSPSKGIRPLTCRRRTSPIRITPLRSTLALEGVAQTHDTRQASLQADVLDSGSRHGGGIAADGVWRSDGAGRGWRDRGAGRGLWAAQDGVVLGPTAIPARVQRLPD